MGSRRNNMVFQDRLSFPWEVKRFPMAMVLIRIMITVESRFNEPLCNEVLRKTNDIPSPSNSKIEKNLDITKPLYSEPISSVPSVVLH